MIVSFKTYSFEDTDGFCSLLIGLVALLNASKLIIGEEFFF